MFFEGVTMFILELLNDELNREKELLSQLQLENAGQPDSTLLHSLSGRGKSNFYYRPKSKAKKVFIKSSETELMRSILDGRIHRDRVRHLESNIPLLEKAVSEIKDYSCPAVIDSLPKAYRNAKDLLDALEDSKSESSPSAPAQSENPYNRDELVHTVSNGLMVRSKNEMLIAEMLILYDVKFYYEKALELTKTHVRHDGSVWYEKVTVYPDFTIYLPDGTVIYWEHAGLMDNPGYRARHFEKIGLYYDNNIYEPKNLIVTMDGKGKPFDNAAIKRIIQERLLKQE